VKKLALIFVMLALSSFGFAAPPAAARSNPQAESAAVLAQQNVAQAATHSPLATSACSFTFASGSGDTFLHYCVTANGNITQLETPQGHEHIAIGAKGEGYGFCDDVPKTAYFDYADFGDSGNWSPATVLSQSPTSVKIARTTRNGIWTLTQTVTQVASSSPSVRVAMTLTNNSTVDRFATILRFADVDADGFVNNNVDSTFDSAFVWNSIGSNHGFGLMIQNVVKGAFFTPLTETTASPPDVCNLVQNVLFQSNTDGSMGMYYLGIPVPKGTSITETISYTGL